jgi:hypothetical protein
VLLSKVKIAGIVMSQTLMQMSKKDYNMRIEDVDSPLLKGIAIMKRMEGLVIITIVENTRKLRMLA